MAQLHSWDSVQCFIHIDYFWRVGESCGTLLSRLQLWGMESCSTVVMEGATE